MSKELDTEQKPSEGKPGEKPGETSFDEKMKELQETVKGEGAASSTLAKLVADPNIRAYLDAKQKGEDVSLVPAMKEPESLLPPQDEDKSIDLEELSRAELVAFTARTVANAIAPAIDKKLEAFTDKIRPLEQSVQNTESLRVTDAISEAQKLYPDFDEHRPVMAQLAQTNPNLNPKQLYVLAKESQGTLFRRTGLESEKPDVLASPEVKSSEGKYRGSSGLDSLIKTSIGKAFNQ